MSNQAHYNDIIYQDLGQSPGRRQLSEDLRADYPKHRALGPQSSTETFQRYTTNGPYAAPVHQQFSSKSQRVTSLAHPHRSPVQEITPKPADSPSTPCENRQRAPRRDKFQVQQQQQQQYPSKSQFMYQPHRANNAVFEDSPEEIERSRQAARTKKSSKLTLPNSKFAIFSKTNGEKSSMYMHRKESDDALELMPTIAMGYENSLDKQMRGRSNPGELRITGNGYYFQPGAEEAEQVNKYADEFIHDVYKDESYSRGFREGGNGGSSPAKESPNILDNSERNPISRTGSFGGLQRPVFVERSRSVSRGRELDMPSRPPSRMDRSKSASRAPQSPLEQVPINKALVSEPTKKEKRVGFFKKVFSVDKSKRKNKRVKTSDVITDNDAGQIPRSPHVLPSISTIDTPSHSRAIEISLETPVIQSPGDSHSQEVPEATLADVVGSIPIISYIFAKIDQNESLSDQSKLLIKVGMMIWIMYEMQMIYESVGAFFGRTK